MTENSRNRTCKVAASRALLAVSLCLAMAACSSSGTRSPAPTSGAGGASSTAGSAPPAPQTESTPEVSAHRQLLDKADQAAARGDYEAALALLERAQRIEPDNGEIYLELARVYDARGDQKQARATAERGLLYCSGASQCDQLRAFTR